MNWFTMSLRKQQAEISRQALLDAARVEFGEKGFEKASIRSIAEAAGMATGTVFNYAESKLDLLHQVLFGELEVMCAKAIAESTEGPIVEQLVNIAGCMLDGLTQAPDLSRVLLKESFFAGGARGLAFRDQVERVAGNVAERIVAAKAEGELRNSLDVGVSTLLFVSVYYFSLISCLAEERPDVAAGRRRIRIQLQQAYIGD